MHLTIWQGTAKVEVIPCFSSTGAKIFLIDTPGFDDSHRPDSDILREIANWLNESFQCKVVLTGLIYLHRIIDVRLGGAGTKNIRMFRKLCGDNGLGSVVLATTMWSLCLPEDADRREDQLVSQNDLWKSLVSQGAKVFRQDDGLVSGHQILNYLIQRAQPVILEIQLEMGEQGKSLSKTSAGLEVQADLEKMKEEHAEELKEIRKDMDVAIKAKDIKLQAELKLYGENVDRQIKVAKEQAKRLEASAEQLRKEMQAQHTREMKEMKFEISRRQKELEKSRNENKRQTETLWKELAALKEKAERQEMTNNFRYNYDYMAYCKVCEVDWLFKEKSEAKNYHCHTCQTLCKLVV